MKLRAESSRTAIATFAAVAALASTAPAHAQNLSEASSEEQADADNASNEITVTGSRVARPGFQSPNPMSVLTTEDLESSAPSANIADAINQLPELAGSVSPANSRLANSSGAAGVNQLNLRNLGASRTLVLLDGRRMVGSTADGRVDINNIPQALISRVDVVTGGASAAYGSNAVSGVVNFILDKKFTGVKGTIDSGITQEGDNFNYSANVAAGFSFAGGRGHFIASGEWAHRDGVFTAREWNNRGYLRILNPEYSASTPNGQPQYLVRSGVGSNTLIPGGIITSGPLKGTYFGPGGSVNQFDYGSYSNSTHTIGGDWLLSDANRTAGAAATEDRRGAFGRISYEFSPAFNLYAEASYNWQTSLFSAFLHQGATTLKSTNAYLVNALGAEALEGLTTVSLNRTAPDWPALMNNNTRSVQRYTFGGDGEFEAFSNQARWSAYAQYGTTNAREQLLNNRHNARYAAAIDAVFAPDGNDMGVPAGTIVCASSLTNPSNGCAPINLIGTGVADPAGLAYAFGDVWRDQKLEQFVAGADLSATPFSTWAGDVSVALGAAYRHEKVSGFVPTEYQTGWAYGNFLATHGSDSVTEAYIEAVAPLGFGLEVNGAVRGINYSRSGYVTAWKLGGTWQPIPDVLFRATQSRDIREPNLSELYATGTSRTNNLTDPFTNETGVRFNETIVGNPNLRPEQGDSTTAGVVLRPRAIPSLSFSADWFQSKVKDAIASFAAQDIINLCYLGNQDFCAAYGPDTSEATVYTFLATRFNAQSVKVSGIDFALNYRLNIGDNGRLSFNANATRYLEHISTTGIPQDQVINTVGQLSGSTPTWSYRATLTYDTPVWAATLAGRGVSSGKWQNNYIECQSNCPVSTVDNPTIDVNHASAPIYIDANFRVKIGDRRLDKAELFLHVSNLFNSDPIMLPIASVAANMTYSDLLGRAFRVGIRFRTK